MAPARRRDRCAALIAALLACGCELTEITIAPPEDVIVGEVILRAGEHLQYAYLHRTLATGPSARVDSALVSVRDEATGSELRYRVEPDVSVCVRPRQGEPAPAQTGTCYVAATATDFVRPDGRYALRIEIEGRVLTGRLHVPGALTLLQPTPPGACILAPQQTIELIWTRAPGAWVYVTEVQMPGLRSALRQAGVTVPGEGPVELTGLSISGTDTTLVFPSELGLFDRFDEDLHPIVLAIQGGLPRDVVVNLTIGAGDRNYVNWVRGGVFNPSGQVRVPSIQGDGTGVFGALVTLHYTMGVGGDRAPPCS